MSVAMTRVTTRGVVFVHATPAALCPHITWAIERALERPVALDWTRQPLGHRQLRAETAWSGEPGTGAKLASALRHLTGVRYEVTEDPSPGVDGSRWSSTPALGLRHTWTAANGDAVVNEDRLRAALVASRGDATMLRHELDLLLGTAWDQELDPYRHAGEDAPVCRLHRVG